MNLNDKQVLVTGAEGFIGSHLVERLHALGAQVTCFVKYHFNDHLGNLALLPQEIQDQLTIIPGDIQDQTVLRKATANKDAVFHLAALIGIPYSYSNPQDNFQTNVMGTFNVMQSCLDNGVPTVVHTSTSEVYGTPKKLPLHEDSPLIGQSPYSASKIGADKVAESFYHSFDLPVGTLRPFNSFGPRQSMRAIIPTIISQALHHDVVTLGNLHPTRDYTYVTDIADAFIKMATSDNTAGEVVVTGHGKEISIKELAERILSLMDLTKDVVQEEKRKRPQKSEILRLCADPTKARELLGWTPQVTLDEGLQKTIAWVTQHLKDYKPRGYTV